MDTESISRERDDGEITDLSKTEGPCEAPQRYVQGTVCTAGVQSAFNANYNIK